jgi:hypothetical protein
MLCSCGRYFTKSSSSTGVACPSCESVADDERPDSCDQQNEPLPGPFGFVPRTSPTAGATTYAQEKARCEREAEDAIVAELLAKFTRYVPQAQAAVKSVFGFDPARALRAQMVIAFLAARPTAHVSDAEATIDRLLG